MLNAIQAVGAMTEAEDEAMDVALGLRERLHALERIVLGRREHGFVPPRVIVLEGLEPPIAVGRWVPEQVRLAGGWELLGREGEAPASTTWDAVREMEPEVLVLAPRGLDLARGPARRGIGCLGRRAGERSPLSRAGRVFAVDGPACFDHPGPRVIDGIEVLAELIDPAAFDGMAPPDTWAQPDLTARPVTSMSFRAAFECLWCGDRWTVRAAGDLEGWAQLCPACLGRAGTNAFLRGRLRSALAARAATAPPGPVAATPRPIPSPARSAAFPDDWFLRRGAFEHGPIHDAAFAAELDVVTRWLDELPAAARIAEPAAGVGFFSPLLAARAELHASDPDGDALDRARERLLAHRLRAHLHVADPWTAPAGEPVDQVVAAFLLGRVRGGGLDAAAASLRARLGARRDARRHRAPAGSGRRPARTACPGPGTTRR